MSPDPNQHWFCGRRDIGPVAALSITHKSWLEVVTYGDVHEAMPSPAHDSIARRRIVISCQIPAELGDLCQVSGDIFVGARRAGPVGRKLVQNGAFLFRQHERGRGIGRKPIHHGHPKVAPAQEAEDCDQVDQAVGSPQPRIFCSAPGFEDLVEDLDFPPLGVPAQLFDGFVIGADRKIGDQFPVDGGPMRGRIFLGRVNNRYDDGGTMLTLCDRCDKLDLLVFQLNDRLIEFAALAPDVDCARRRDRIEYHIPARVRAAGPTRIYRLTAGCEPDGRDPRRQPRRCNPVSGNVA